MCGPVIKGWLHWHLAGPEFEGEIVERNPNYYGEVNNHAYLN
jgi:hypothetical protein